MILSFHKQILRLFPGTQDKFYWMMEVDALQSFHKDDHNLKVAYQ
jgi:hypothetical protein